MTAADESNSQQHDDSGIHHRPDGSVEPDVDAAQSGEDAPDASADDVDASTHHGDQGKTDTKPDAGKNDAGIPNDAGAPIVVGDAGSDASTSDASTDSGIDAGTDDASIDASTDSGSDDASTDAGSDASTDAGEDASTDAGSDAGDDAGADAGDDAGPDASLPPCTGPEDLYKDAFCSVLSDGIVEYVPQYPLWSDGAEKTRWIKLPAGKKIDTSNPDRWSFPKGTKFYKEFAWGTKRVETRVLEKTADDTVIGYDGWTVKTYAWNDAGTAVSLAPTGGVKNALGTPLEIPSAAACKQCHGAWDATAKHADAPIGFNAIQLNHTLGGLTLSKLLNDGTLKSGNGATQITLANSLIPGATQAEREGMGYLHGNCGHCHGGPNPRAGQELYAGVNIATLDLEPVSRTAICECLENWKGRSNDSTPSEQYKLRIYPSRADVSGVIGRMSRRGQGEQMPPVGTNIVDDAGIAKVKAWIQSLDVRDCDTHVQTCQ